MAQGNDYKEVMKDLQGYFKKGERKRLYLACESIRDKVLVRLLWKSGRRVGELLLLKVGEINFEDNNIIWHIEKKKKPTQKIKPIDNFTLRLLKYYIETEGLGPEDYVLPISRQRVFQIIRRLGEKTSILYVGTKKIHPHHFRHSFAIDMVKRSSNAGDIVKVQKLLEHTNLNTTESYLQFSSEDLREMIEREDE